MSAVKQHDIILTTLNARFMHTAFGLRYLYANLDELQPVSIIKEFTIHERPIDIVEKLLQHHPKIIGIGVYIWNASEIRQIVELLKQVSPETVIVLGGPEMGFEDDLPDFAEYADYIVAGAAEKTFRDLCKQILSGNRPVNRFIQSVELPLDQLEFPYQYYTDEDIKNRLIYVEASRGCPFKCEFCLSSLDKTSKPFELGVFLDQMEQLYKRGVRNYKFIDRTFNLKVSTSIAILEFFLKKINAEDNDLYLHFELIPDNLPNKLKSAIQQFPPHAIQFEIGIQTFDENIQSLISRKQDNQKTVDNLKWLREATSAWLHTDLIFGLPGDTLDNFAESFDKLVALKPHEIQLGILKRLRGVPLNRHNNKYQLRYNPEPPYNILSTSKIDFEAMQTVSRFARYWDIIANSGRFRNVLPFILGDNPFSNFMRLSEDIFHSIGTTWKISQRRIFIEVYHSLLQREGNLNQWLSTLKADYQASGEKAVFESIISSSKVSRIGVANKRQLTQRY